MIQMQMKMMKKRFLRKVSYQRNMHSWLYLTKRKLHNKEDGNG